MSIQILKWTHLYDAVMNNVTLTKQQVQELKRVLEQASDFYYNGLGEIMPDAIYDDLQECLTKKYKVSLKDGAPTMGNKLKHTSEQLLGSLHKCHSVEELKEWLESVSNRIGRYPQNLLASFKYDGLSVAIDYNENSVTAAYSRGQDGYGQDLSRFFNLEMNGQKLPLFDENVSVKYEAIMTSKNFEQYSQEYLLNTGKTLSDARTAVASILGQHTDPTLVRYITLVSLDVSPALSHDFRIREMNRLAGYLNKNGTLCHSVRVLETFQVKFERGSYKVYHNCADAEERAEMSLEEFYEFCQKIRNTSDFLMDGLVFELTDEDDKKILGFDETDGKCRPKWAIALKYPPAAAVTELLNVELDLAYSYSGRITPVACIKPVFLNGKTYSRVSLSNWSRIKDENIMIGQPMTLTVNGDVLAYVKPVVDGNTYQEVPIPTHCPVCDGAVKSENDGIWLFCSNPNCPIKARGKVYNYLSKIRVKGIAESTIDRLFEAGLVSNIASLYDCDFDAVANLPGFGKKSSDALIDALSQRQTVYDFEFFGAWNWPTVGRTIMRTIFRHITYEKIIEAFANKDKSTFIVWLAQIPGVGNIIARNIFMGLHKDLEEMDYIESNYVTLISSTPEKGAAVENSKSYKVVVTGDLEQYGREEFKNLLAQNGHKMVSAISSKVDYLITNFPNSGTVKIKEAKKLGIKIVTEKEFFEISGLGRM